jgi:hypothetical protein
MDRETAAVVAFSLGVKHRGAINVEAQQHTLTETRTHATITKPHVDDARDGCLNAAAAVH